MNEIYRLCVGILVVWRVTHLLHAEDGPWNLIARARDALARRKAGGVFGCFYCSSMWVAAPAGWVLGTSVPESTLLWLAFSAGAILIERLTDREEGNAAPYFEGDHHELLRARGENLRWYD